MVVSVRLFQFQDLRFTMPEAEEEAAEMEEAL